MLGINAGVNVDCKKELIKYFKSLGIEVHTRTKARGHQGFFLKNRIDISKNTREEKIIPTLLHEFAHYIHAKIEPDMPKNGGSLEVLFNLSTYQLINSSTLKKELLRVTNFVDANSHLARFLEHKEQVKKRIKFLEGEIKKDYPDFMRSKKFKEFDKYIKKSKAKYLLKYDRVKLISPFLRNVEVFTIDNLERDFPDMPPAFCACIRLKSAQKKQSRISARINRLNKYYEKPTELFARFIEGLYTDEARTRAYAPCAAHVFFELLEQGYYFELKDVFEILQKIREKEVLRS